MNLVEIDPFLKLAVTLTVPVTVTVHEPVPEQAPDQPENVFEPIGVAVRVTGVPAVASVKEQSEPQLIPEGEDVTVPRVGSSFVTLRVLVTTPPYS